MVRTPIIAVLPAIPGFVELVEKYYVIYCLLLAVTAGVFEMLGRWIVAKIIGEAITFKKGVAAGLGHGSIESILLIGVTYVNNLLYIMAINNGTFDSLIEQAAAAGQNTDTWYEVREALLGSVSGVIYLAGYERVLTLVIHIALSLIVCYFVWKKKTAQGLVICAAAHTAVDFITGVLTGLPTEYMGNLVSEKVGYALIYVFLTLVAVGAGYVIYRIGKVWKEEVV